MATNKVSELSAYTVAKNCTDLTDVMDGISEMKEHFKACEKSNKKPTARAYIRLAKLEAKRQQLSKLN